ncbi:SoxR reducing system RseC family protein [Pseudomonadales bacterium]|nr:SoxR reducing system RseC family protein [Pseudomonadales bacterium]MDA8965878.1 SoxR reducing system RseC family protein [Pseudomonadales bacterium]
MQTLETDHDPSPATVNTPEASPAEVVGMTIERACVVSVEQTSTPGQSLVWLEAFRRSTCGDCAAQDTCGQGVLGRWFARKQRYYNVRCPTTRAGLLTVGQWVEVGIPDGVLVRAALLAYLFPIAGLLLAAVVADWLLLADWVVACLGLLGLGAGLLIGRAWGERLVANGAAEPTLLESAVS